MERVYSKYIQKYHRCIEYPRITDWGLKKWEREQMKLLKLIIWLYPIYAMGTLIFSPYVFPDFPSVIGGFVYCFVYCSLYVWGFVFFSLEIIDNRKKRRILKNRGNHPLPILLTFSLLVSTVGPSPVNLAVMSPQQALWH